MSVPVTDLDAGTETPVNGECLANSHGADQKDGAGYGLFMKRFTNADMVGTSVGEILDGTGAAVHMLGGDGDDTYIVDSADDTVTELAGEGTDLVDAFISYTLGDNVENLILDGSDNIDGTGNADSNGIVGNVGANILDGGGGADIMMGGDGNDTYVIDDINDVYIEADGEGYDEIEVGWTYTLLEGGFFEDLHLTGIANIDGTGNSGDNNLTGNDGNNLLLGLQGDDAIDGGLGDDTMTGGDGDDTYVVDSAGDLVIETDEEGLDIVYSTISYVLGAHLDGVILDPSGTADLSLTGNSLSNILFGNDGNNSLNGMGGVDIMYGYGGNDVYYVNSYLEVVSEELDCGCDAGGTDKVYSSDDVYLPDYVEQLTLTGTADLYGIGNDEDNVLRGNSGDNTLDGDVGNDKIDGGLGADTMFGGSDNDTYYVDDNGDQTIEDYDPGVDDGGTDTVIASISWTIATYIENLALSGTGDIDATGNSDNNILRGNAGANTLSGGAGADTLAGGAGNDTYYIDINDRISEAVGGGTDTVRGDLTIVLGNNFENLILTGSDGYNGYGNGLDNTLTGNDGNNRLNGGLGVDTLYGGDGNDTYYVDDVDDLASEEIVASEDDGGTDGVIATADFRLGAFIENLKLTGTDNLSGTGNDLNNLITGNSGDNTIDGGLGADTMSGGTGNDTYSVDDVNDRVTELTSGGHDLVIAALSHTLRLSVEDLTLAGTDNLNGNGNSLNNVLTGNDGDNKLDGRAGDDTLYGGDGNDTYYVDSTGDTVSEDSTPGSDDGGTDRVMSSVDWTLGAYVEYLNLTGSDNIDGTGNDLANLIRGNDGNNGLRGGAGNDGLIGSGGADDFVFEAAGAANGKDRVYDFLSGTDHLVFTGGDYGIAPGHSLTGSELTVGSHAVGSSAQFVFVAGSSTLYWDDDGEGGAAAVAIALLSGITTLSAGDFIFG